MASALLMLAAGVTPRHRLAVLTTLRQSLSFTVEHIPNQYGQKPNPENTNFTESEHLNQGELFGDTKVCSKTGT